MNKFVIGSLIVFLLAGIGYLVVKGTGQPGIPPQSTDIQPQITNPEILERKGEYEVTSYQTQYFETVNGFYAKPKLPGNYPGVVMIHEWWGLNDNIKNMASQLASYGYRVLAVDLYNGKVALTAEEARQYTSSLNKAKAMDNLKSAVSFLKDEGAEKIASLGWCFGGGQSFQLALSGQQLDATIIYYGTLETEKNKLSRIKWPVLGIFGAKDQSIAEDTVKKFDNVLDSLNIDNEIYIYPDVGHAFANPSGENYAPKETKDAWEKTLIFLQKNLKDK